MPPSFLRKKLRQTSSAQQQPLRKNPHNNTIVRHSLSLPDLTTPLLDPSSWEEVPPFTFTFPAVHTPDSKSDPSSKRTPKGGGVGMVLCCSPKQKQQHQDQQGLCMTSPSARASGIGLGNTIQTRNRTPSFVGNEVQFHRPFMPNKVVNPFSGGWKDGDFRMSHAVWDRGGTFAEMGVGTRGVRESMPSVISRRKTRKKGAAEKMNIVVAGRKGAGKTRQVDFKKRAGISAPLGFVFHPQPHRPAPTTKPTAYTVLSTISDRLLLRVIDTPGLDLSLGEDQVAAKEGENERNVKGLLNIVEERFEYTLREERKVRRRVGAEEGLVHLVIYLIDARDVLYPKEPRAKEVDWSCLGLFDDEPKSQQGEELDSERKDTPKGGLEPRLLTAEIDIIRQLEKRANVLPVLSHTDSLTIDGLEDVKAAVNRDLTAAFARTPGKGFGVFRTGDDESLQHDSIREKGEDPDDANVDLDVDVDKQGDHRPPTPDSTHLPISSTSLPLPFGIFIPEPSSRSSSDDHNTVNSDRFGSSSLRKFAWGEASALNPAHSDFLALREAILGNYSKALKTRTREALYESYRTERLLAGSRVDE
ncbi:septin ring protein [Cryptococcus neoformans 125.91]|nr:septin ring protein [Cryptococcus neoformans var. grubii 125.91]